MSQVTPYLPDRLEALARQWAQDAGKSLSGYLAGLLAHEMAPPEWSAALLSVLNEGSGDIEVPDLLIAAIALAAGVQLVTRNVEEFSRVPGLPVERW